MAHSKGDKDRWMLQLNVRYFPTKNILSSCKYTGK